MFRWMPQSDLLSRRGHKLHVTVHSSGYVEGRMLQLQNTGPCNRDNLSCHIVFALTQKHKFYYKSQRLRVKPEARNLDSLWDVGIGHCFLKSLFFLIFVCLRYPQTCVLSTTQGRKKQRTKPKQKTMAYKTDTFYHLTVTFPTATVLLLCTCCSIWQDYSPNHCAWANEVVCIFSHYSFYLLVSSGSKCEPELSAKTVCVLHARNQSWFHLKLFVSVFYQLCRMLTTPQRQMNKTQTTSLNFDSQGESALICTAVAHMTLHKWSPDNRVRF